MPRRKKDRGRPPVKPMPERIDASPEEIAERFLSLPADYEWQYDTTKRTRPNLRNRPSRGLCS